MYTLDELRPHEFERTPVLPQVEIVDSGDSLCVDFGGCPENHAGGPVAPCARRLVDPHGLRQRRRGRRVAQNALGLCRIGLSEHACPLVAFCGSRPAGPVDQGRAPPARPDVRAIPQARSRTRSACRRGRVCPARPSPVHEALGTSPKTAPFPVRRARCALAAPCRRDPQPCLRKRTPPTTLGPDYSGPWGQCLTVHSSIASYWRGVRGVDLITPWIVELRDADRPNRAAIVVSGSFGRARCKVKH